MFSPVLRLVGAVVLVMIMGSAGVRGQTAPAEASAIPELEALKGPYQRNLATIQKAADARMEFANKAYAAALDRLQKADSGVAVPVAAELERLAAKKDPTAQERGSFPPALATLRAQYDADRQRTLAPYLQEEAKQTRQYLSALEVEQRRLVAQNQIQKAAALAAERDAMGGPKPVTDPKPEKVAAESTVHTVGQLDPRSGASIAAAVSAKTVIRTDSSSGDKEGWPDVPEEGALLVGFEFMEVHNKGGEWIRSVRPYFMTRQGIVPGKDRGKMVNVSDKVMARPGFAVSALFTDHKAAMQVVFMKVDPATGRFEAGPNNVYKSKWFGAKNHEKAIQIGGDGSLVVGVFGKTGADCDTIGLVEMPAAP